MRRLSLWMRARPMVGDSLLAALILVADLMLMAATNGNAEPAGAPWHVAVLLTLVLPATLVVRRKYPVAFAYSALLLGIPHAELLFGFSPLATICVALYTLLVYVGRRPALLYLVISVVVTTGQLIFLMNAEAWPWVLIVVAVTSSFCWLLGEFVGARRAYHAELEARLRLLETERDQASRIAVAKERGRIARELHDVVAHAVSVIVVQADGARYALRGSPDLAERALDTISDTGRSALAELRRLLDVLRGEEEDSPRVPQPSAAALEELAERIRAAGLRVDVDLDDDLDDLPAGVSLGVYRIVQESLTNALKHAGKGAWARVDVVRADGVVRVEVTDDGAGRAHAVPAGAGTLRAEPAGGNGLIGMRERAHVYGGRLDVGPKAGGGWRVDARLPVVLDR